MAKKREILSITLAVALLLAAAIPVGALKIPVRAVDDDEKCERRIHKAEQNLEKAVYKYGEYSKKAEQRRHELEEARERCRHDREHDGDHDHDHDQR